VALVTGASSGIGEETARLLDKAGYTTYAVARRVDRMAALEKAGVHTFAMDVTDDASMVAGINRIVVDKGRIDVLVNNAGYGSYGAVEDVPIDEARRQFEVNVFGLARLTQLVTPTMREHGAGRIINVSSVAAFQPGPLMSVYYASKAYVQSFSEALSEETSGSGVTVTAVCPGPTASEFQTASGLHPEAPTVGAPLMTSREVAELAYRGAAGGKRVVVTGLRNKIVVLANRLLSRRRMTRLVRRLQERRREASLATRGPTSHG